MVLQNLICCADFVVAKLLIFQEIANIEKTSSVSVTTARREYQDTTVLTGGSMNPTQTNTTVRSVENGKRRIEK